MATTNLYLDLRAKAKDGKGSVIITIYHNASTASIPTGVRLPPSEWNKSTQKAIRVSGCEALNARLQTQKSDIDKAIAMLSMDDAFADMTAPQLKHEIVGGKPKKAAGRLVSDLFQEYLNTGNLKDSTKETYEITLKKIRQFAGPHLKMQDINLKWLRSFETYLAKTQTINGRSIYLRNLRAVCRYSWKNKLISDYPFAFFQIKRQETRKKGVLVNKLREFMHYPTSVYNERYRDYFFLMFYLIGINVIDLFKAQKSQVVDGRLLYTRSKTGRKYSIKIEPEARALLDKYAGSEDNLIEAADHCQHYKSFAHMLNDALKSIGEMVTETLPSDDLFEEATISHIEPLIPGITSNVARHCWATFALEIGIPIEIISQAMGHSAGSKTTWIYIKPNPAKVDEANRKVIDYLLGKA